MSSSEQETQDESLMNELDLVVVRSGGRGPSASLCDNSGWRCGQPSIAATRTHGDRVPKVSIVTCHI